MNNVCLSGNICKPVELRKTQNGKSVASFSLAINEGKDKTEFVNCVAWEKTADLMNEYVSKGDRLSCVGKLQTRSWEDDSGSKRYATEVVVFQFDFPPKRSDVVDNGGAYDATGKPDMHDIMDDEIPF